MNKTLHFLPVIALAAVLFSFPAAAAEAPARAAVAAPAVKVADLKAVPLAERLPAGSRTAVLVKVDKLLASDFYKQVCISFAEFPMVLAVLEAQYQVPVKNIRQLIYFNGESNRNGAVLFELKNLPEKDFAARVAKLNSAPAALPAVANLPVTPLQSLASRTAKIGNRTVYLISGQSAEGAERRTIGVTYLAPDVAIAAEEDALNAYFSAAQLSETDRKTLFAAAPNEENAAEFSYLAPPRNERKKGKNAAFSPVRQLETFQGACRLDGEQAITIAGIGTLRDEKAVTNAMMGLNGLIFMGIGVFFAENQPLGDEVLNNLSLVPEGRNITGNFSLSKEQLQKLLVYSKKRIPQLLVPPDDPVGPVEIPADAPPATKAAPAQPPAAVNRR